MKTPITYYGGKQLLAPTIIKMIPPHKVYCEPYFGGGAVFWSKGPSYLEVINDINDRLMIFWETLQTDFEELNEMIQKTLTSEYQYRKAKDIYLGRVKASKVQIAWSVWVLTNLSFTASPYGGWKWDNGTAGCHIGRTTDHYRNQFSKALQLRLRYVQISSRPAIDVIKERDSEHTFFYLDPPYPGCNQKHYSGFTDNDLDELLDVLESLKGKFILSNYMRDNLKSRIDKKRWNFLVKDMALKCANFHNKGRRKQEVLVYNYEMTPNLFT